MIEFCLDFCEIIMCDLSPNSHISGGNSVIEIGVYYKVLLPLTHHHHAY